MSVMNLTWKKVPAFKLLHMSFDTDAVHVLSGDLN